MLEYKDNSKPYVFITGVSSGIGLDCFGRLIKSGYQVIGTVRSHEDRKLIESAHPNNAYVILMDVTNPESIIAAVDKVAEITKKQGLYAIINNAGIVEPGPLELLTEDKFHQVMNVNLYGVRRVTNALLPFLRANIQSKSRIINISSVSGLIPYPFNGAYSISKHALECLSDVYRRELLDEGIDVITIQPGSIKTKIWEKSLGKMSQFSDSSYNEIIKKADAVIENIAENAGATSKVTRVILKALRVSRPKTRYLIYDKKWTIKLMNWLPDRWTDRLMMKRFKMIENQRPV